MGSSSTKQEQESSQTSAPPSWTMGGFVQGANDALNAYNQGKGGNVYQGDRVTDLSGQTTNSIDGLQNAANGYNNSTLQGLVNNGTSSASNLSGMASGQMIGNNEKFNEALQNTLNNTANTINSQMSGAGRYGSGAHSGVMGNQLGQIATNAMSQQYNQDVQNMMNANSSIDSANQGQINSANSFLQGQSNSLLNAMQGGSVLDQNNQDKLNANWDKWSEEDNKEFNRVNMLLAAMQGASGNYGTQTGTQSQTQSQSGNWLSALGSIGSTGINLFGKSALSDMRAKENITPLGERNGFPFYEFSYKGDKTRYRGVMAQDVLKIMPDAVEIDPNKPFMMVDYGKIGLKMEKVS